MLIRFLVPALLLATLMLAGCAKLALSNRTANTKSDFATPVSRTSAVPLKQMDAKSYCAAHCASMNDRERIEYFAKFIWAPYVDHLNRPADPAARAITLQLNGGGKDWENAAREAALFTKVSPGQWNMRIVVTPRETVKQLAELASKFYSSSDGPGEVVISGLLKAGDPRIEITKVQ